MSERILNPSEIAEKYVKGKHDALTDSQEMNDMERDILLWAEYYALTQANEDGSHKEADISASIMRRLLNKKSPHTIKVVIPRNWKNCGITISNHFVSDTNNSKSWDNLKFPLPKPKYKWQIKCYTGDMDDPDKTSVILVDKF